MSSQRIARLVEEAPHEGFDLVALKSRQCQGSSHHSPTPMMTRCYDLYAYNENGDTPQIEDPESAGIEQGQMPVWLCATCHDNLTTCLFLLHHYDGAPGDSVKRDFGNIILRMAEQAFGHRALIARFK